MIETIMAILFIPWILFWLTAAVGAVIMLIAIGYFGHWLVTTINKKFTKK